MMDFYIDGEKFDQEKDKIIDDCMKALDALPDQEFAPYKTLARITGYSDKTLRMKAMSLEQQGYAIMAKHAGTRKRLFANKRTIEAWKHRKAD